MANRERENRRRLRNISPEVEKGSAPKSQDRDIRIEPKLRRQAARKARKQEPDLHRFEGKELKRQEAAEKELALELRRERRRQQAIAEEQQLPPEELVHRNRQKTEAKRKQRKKTVLRIFLIVLGVTLLGVLIFNLLRVRTLQVEGLQWMQPEQVIELSGIQMGDTILQLNEEEVKAKIEKDPHFILEDMRYQFPTGIVLEVTERQEAACFSFANTYVKIDPNGLILGHVEKKDGTDLPIVEGLEVTEFVLGAEIRTTDTYKQDVLRKVLDALCKAEQHKNMETIDMHNVNQVWMRTKAGVEVCLGQASELDKKFQWLEEIVATISAEGYSGGTIDLTSTLAPVYKQPEQLDEDGDQAATK